MMSAAKLNRRGNGEIFATLRNYFAAGVHLVGRKFECACETWRFVIGSTLDGVRSHMCNQRIVFMTTTPHLLTPDELSAVRTRWELTSDKGSWGKEDVAALLGHVEALEREYEIARSRRQAIYAAKTP